MEGFEIDLFEKTGILGGRLNITTVFGNGYETGGSVIHARNKYAVELVKKFGT
jgi:prenylcysteine oxidase/farnesylcysteine lyase